MSAAPWSSKSLKGSVVDADAFLILDSSTAIASEINKRLTALTLKNYMIAGFDSGILTLNGNTNPAQVILEGSGIDIVDLGSNHTISVDTTIPRIASVNIWTAANFFKSSLLKISDSDNSNEYTIVTGDLTSNFDLLIPAITENESFVLEDTTQTLKNKTLNVSDGNTFSGLTLGSQVTGASTNLSDSSSLARNTDNLSFFASTSSTQLLGVMSDETGTGLLVFNASPVIVTPTIASFLNANHGHADAAGGGQLTAPDFVDATGVPSGTTFLRGDNVWATPSGSVSFPVSDTEFGVFQLANSDRIVKFDLTSYSSAGIKSVAFPDASGTLALLEISNTFTISQRIETEGSSSEFFMDSYGNFNTPRLNLRQSNGTILVPTPSSSLTALATFNSYGRTDTSFSIGFQIVVTTNETWSASNIGTTTIFYSALDNTTNLLARLTIRGEDGYLEVGTGLESPFYQSVSPTSPATTGLFRMETDEFLSWRNHGDNGEINLGLTSGSDYLETNALRIQLISPGSSGILLLSSNGNGGSGGAIITQRKNASGAVQINNTIAEYQYFGYADSFYNLGAQIRLTARGENWSDSSAPTGYDIQVTKTGETTPTSAIFIDGGNLNATQLKGDKLSFYNTAPVVKPTITGNKSSNTALVSLLTALDDLGLVLDSTT